MVVVTDYTTYVPSKSFRQMNEVKLFIALRSPPESYTILTKFVL
jgi:hypothetical protein